MPAVLGGCLLALMAGGAGCRPAVITPPSILILAVDTLRSDRVAALGSGQTHGGPPDDTHSTPEIDRWATRAAVFRNAVTPAPFTMPAMAALMTGRYPDRCGVVAHEPGVSLGAWNGRTLAEAARAAGIETAAVIANPWLARGSTGFDRGFSSYRRVYQPDAAPGSSGAAAVADETIRLLDGVGDRRFLVWAHFFDPHMPYAPPPAFAHAAGAGAGPSRIMRDFDAKDRDLAAIYRGRDTRGSYSPDELEQARRLYDGEVRYVDHAIGRVLERLRTSGRDRDTIVVVVSDHGESLGEHGLFFAHDYTLYDELTRAVLLVSGPGIRPGSRDEAVSLIDLMPTLCRLAALDCGDGFDGRDLFGSDRTPRTLFAAATPLRSKGSPFPRLTVPGIDGRWTMALRDGCKLIRIPVAAKASTDAVPPATFELYDLRRDPGEVRNLAGTASVEESSLRQELDTWLHAMDEMRPPQPASRPRGRKARADRETLRSLGYLQ